MLFCELPRGRNLVSVWWIQITVVYHLPSKWILNLKQWPVKQCLKFVNSQEGIFPNIYVVCIYTIFAYHIRFKQLKMQLCNYKYLNVTTWQWPWLPVFPLFLWIAISWHICNCNLISDCSNEIKVNFISSFLTIYFANDGYLMAPVLSQPLVMPCPNYHFDAVWTETFYNVGFKKHWHWVTDGLLTWLGSSLWLSVFCNSDVQITG